MYRAHDLSTPLGAYDPQAKPADDQCQATRPRRRTVPAKIVCRLLAPLDAAVVLAMAFVAYAIDTADGPRVAFTHYAAVTAFGTLLMANLLYGAGMYASAILREPRRTMGRLFGCWALAAGIVLAITVLTPFLSSSHSWAMTWFGLVLAVLTASRCILFTLASRWLKEGRLGRKIAVVGDARPAARLAGYLGAHRANGIYVVGRYADTPEAAADTPQGGRKPDGNLDDLIEHLRNEPVDTVIIAVSNPCRRRLESLERRLCEVPVDVRLCPSEDALDFLEAGVSHFAGVPTLNVMDRPLNNWQFLIKEIEDRTVAALITLAIAPVLLLIALAIRIDTPGPILFRQPRRGYNNRIIEVLKFRTMYAESADPDGERLTKRNDPRITPVGAVLRRWSLDELPQFLNVLRGDMSIVGPRPHALSSKAAGRFYEEAVSLYDARHRVKPGITGLAQIRGWRGPTETVRQIQMRVESDLYYIENWSLWLDLKIIAITAVKGFHSKNAF